jgi:membrane protein involved in colicin uptake
VRAAAESGDAASVAKLKAEAERKAAARKAKTERKAAARKAEAERKAAARKMEAATEQMSCDAWFELSGCGGGVVGGQQSRRLSALCKH